LKLLRKENDTVQILCFPGEDVEKGEYLAIEDLKTGRSILVQVLDTQFVDFPGLLEDMLRNETVENQIFGDDVDPLRLESQINLLRDARLIIGKIRCLFEKDNVKFNVSWVPSRVYSRIYKVEPEKLCRILGLGFRRPIVIGKIGESYELQVNAEDFDGRLTIIIGRKGTGKSHLAKILLLGLVEHGAPCLVFDVNGEYAGLGLNSDGKPNIYDGKIKVLKPGENFKVTFKHAGKHAISNILIYVLLTPETSIREFFRIWDILEETGELTIRGFRKILERDRNIHESVREALLSRIGSMERTGFFTDFEGEAGRLEDLFADMEGGGAVIVDLSELTPLERRMIVELILGRLTELLRCWRLKALFLFAEEAHLYLRETYWEDVVTRMRHIGLFTFFITNQPDSIKDEIYRQADSIFLFNFVNEYDLNVIARVAKIDGETVKSIAQFLQPHHCMTIGYVTRDIPLIVKVRSLNVKAMGETRSFFTAMNRRLEALETTHNF
jgi:hypothetical protein